MRAALEARHPDRVAQQQVVERAVHAPEERAEVAAVLRIGETAAGLVERFVGEPVVARVLRPELGHGRSLAALSATRPIPSARGHGSGRPRRRRAGGGRARHRPGGRGRGRGTGSGSMGTSKVGKDRNFSSGGPVNPSYLTNTHEYDFNNLRNDRSCGRDGGLRAGGRGPRLFRRRARRWG